MISSSTFALPDSMLLAVSLGRRDPTAIFYFILLWLGCQLIVWLVGRDSLDNEWWRSGALAGLATITPTVVFILVVNEGATGLVGAAVVLALLTWIVSGLLYEPELRQRILITVLVPALAAGVFPLAVFLRNLLIESVSP